MTTPKDKIYRVADYGSIEIDDLDRENLLKIANTPIKDLNGLLVFPPDLKTNKDDIGTESIFTINESTLTANDILGFIGVNDTELTIHSRFAKNDQQDYFLHYMVAKVFNINLFDLSHSTSDDKAFDFLLLLFPYFLKEALQQGLYKKYVVNCYNDTHIRGQIDVARFVKMDVPFAGKVAYNVREYSYDNEITQLIRHTIEYIRVGKLHQILKTDPDTKAYVEQICQVTPTYKYHDRARIISKNLKPPTSPFFTKYATLQRLCISILNHKKLKYGEAKNRIYGILFSGSWLWEEYLWKAILKDCSFSHAENKTGKNPIYLFKGNHYHRYPDYYKENVILDAKYKHLDRSDEIDRNDMHQIISYMYVRMAKIGGFVYPHEKDETIKNDLFGELNGYGGDVRKIGIKIPQNTNNLMDFAEVMRNIENEAIAEISNL